MRITQNMSATNSIYNLQQGQAKLDKLQQLTSAGQNVSTPSDDPISARLLIDIGDKVRAIDQHASNINRATAWMQTTSTALQGMSDFMDQAKSIASSINSGSTDPSIRQNANNQLTALKKQIMDMANTQYGDQYIFGGANNTTAPFKEMTGDISKDSNTITNMDITGLTKGMPVSGAGIAANTVITDITAGPPASISLSNPATATATSSKLNFYAGDSTQISTEIGQNATQTLNITGDRLINGTGSHPSYGSTDILATFDKLIAAVGDNTTPSNATAITQTTADLEAGAKQIIIATNDLLSRTTRLDNMSKLNTNSKTTLMNISSNVQSVDYAKLGVELAQQQTAFSASLSATAKVTQLSLLNYM